MIKTRLPIIFLAVASATTFFSCRKKILKEDPDFLPEVRGRIDSLLCDSTKYEGKLFAFFDAGDSVYFNIVMQAAIRGYQPAISIPSSGVEGLTAFLPADGFQAGTGNLKFRIEGTPRGTGQACFSLKVNQSTCSICRTVAEKREKGIAVHSCEAQRIHNPWIGYGRVQDQEGNSYRTVRIGNREWMAENLKTSRYLNGDPIPEVQDRNSWRALLTGAFGWYDNNPALDCPYGKLYNWYALAGIYDQASLNNPALRKQFTPIGWHVPSDAEWNTLITYLGGTLVAGGNMKVTGTAYWISPNTGATNSSGFGGMGGGFRTGVGSFASLGYGCDWWSFSENDEYTAWARYLLYNFNEAIRSAMDKASGFYVRLVKD